MPKKEHLYDQSLDILRSLAILAVVLIHTTTTTIQASSNNLIDFSFSLFLNQAARFAVPMFFIISGYVLELNYNFHSSFFSYIKKRTGKILIPYIFWSLLYYTLIYTNHTESFLVSLIKGDASYQLYFIPSLFIFYLIFPIFHKYLSWMSKPLILLILGLIQLLPLSYDYYIKPIQIFHPLAIVFLNYFMFVFGMIISKNRIELNNLIRKWKNLLISLTTILGVFVFIEGQGRYFKTHNYLSFYSQWRPSVFIYSLCVTSLLLYLLSNTKIHNTRVKFISETSYFVYFVHIAVLTKIWDALGVTMYSAFRTSIVGRISIDPLLFVIVAGISFMIAYFVHKIPFFARLTG